MSGVITTGTFPKLLFPGIRALFGDTYNEYPPEYSYIFESLTSDKNYEEDILVSGTGMAIAKTQGEGISYSTMRQGYIQRYLNITYALGYIITMEEIQDNLYPKFADFRTKQLAISGRQTKETIGANILNRAFSSSYLYGDGVALCANNHPITGSTFSNIPTSHVDLSEAALEDALVAIQNFRNDAGLRKRIIGMKLIVPPALDFEATRILKNPLRPATAERDINAMYTNGMIPDGYVVNHYLTDPDAWFIQTDCPQGLQFFQRMEPTFDMDNDFDTKNAKFSYIERYSFGATDPRALYGSQGA